MIDWPTVHNEALAILVRYLQIDTSNPPGNEKPAARYLGSLLEAEGVVCEYIESAPERETVVARLSGDGSKRPIMLCNHTDVVPVEADYWHVPPFGGVVKDGRIYGRGAVDMKGTGVMHLIAFLLLKRQGIPLKRDLVFCGVPDEEAGSRLGMEWLCEHRPDVVDVEFELSEGGMGASRFAGKGTKLFNIATSEKMGAGLRLTAVGTPGHGSRPHADNSAIHLMRALLKLHDWEREIIYTPATTAYLERLAEAGLLPPLSERIAVETQIRRSPALLAAFINTLNVTIVRSGMKNNVIPAKSEAVIDCRILPGQDREAWRQAVIDRIDDARISVEYARDWKQPANVQADWDTELFRTINSVLKEAMEDAVVVPAMTVGATDNRFLRERGIPAYGFIPCLLSSEEAAGFHGNNEYLAVDNFQMGCELMYEVVRRMVS
ncbi:MAG: M20/M25/M40 family metallo-hydrolase [Anaerolineaceae bacterium]